MSFYLSELELQSYNKNGFIGPFDLYSQDEIKEIWSEVRRSIHDRTFAPYSQDIGYTGVTNIANYDRHLDINLLSDHVCKPNIVHRIDSIFGGDVLCWRSEFFPKYLGDEGTAWHQADTFENASGTPQIVWPLKDNVKAGQGTITVWTAFTDATIKNGCLKFIPGTHTEMHYDETKHMEYRPESINKIEKNGVKQGFFGYDYDDLKIDPNWSPDETKAVSMEMRAGQFIIFSSTLMHASHPHKEGGDRIGYVARYVPTRVKIYPDTEKIVEYGGEVSLEKYGAVLVSGKNTFNHNRIINKNLRGYAFKKN